MPAQAGRSTAEQRKHLLALLTPVVAASGHDLEDVSVQVVGRRSVVRVVIDRDEGVDLDGIAEVSRAVSSTIDDKANDPFAGPYVLEVTSPGVDRPLTERRHWARAVGRLVARGQRPHDGLAVRPPSCKLASNPRFDNGDRGEWA